MYRILTLSLSALLLAGTANASDYEGAYVNLGVTQLSADLDLTQTDVGGEIVNLGNQSPDITMITGRLGYRLNDYFALEGEAGFGLGGDDFDQTVPVPTDIGVLNVDTNINLDVKNYYVGFAKGIIPLGEQFELFGRVGYGAAKAEADVTASLAGITASGSDSEKVSDFAYGVGAQYNFNEQNGLRLDYSSIGGDADIISLSYARRF